MPASHLPEATQHPVGKVRYQRWQIPVRWKAKPTKLRHMDRDARWAFKYAEAKVKAGADPSAARPVDVAILIVATSLTLPSIVRMA